MTDKTESVTFRLSKIQLARLIKYCVADERTLGFMLRRWIDTLED